MFIVSSLLVVALLIAINALYVTAEFAAVSVRPSRVQQLAEEGSARARRLVPFVSNPVALDRYIAACQIGITASSLILGAFGEVAFGPRLASALTGATGWSAATSYPIAAVLVLVALTATQMVLGELLPKAVALRFPVPAALHTAGALALSLRAFAVPIRVLNGSGLLLLRGLGVQHDHHRHVHSPEAIDLLLRESSAGGVLGPQEARRLHNALFLGKGTARQLMVPRDQIVAIALDTPGDEVLRLVSDSPYTRFPVHGASLDDVRGIVHTRDVVLREIETGRAPSLQTLLRPAITAPESTPADRLLGLFQEHRVQLLLVTGEGGRIVGLVTLEDALTELFGELADEFKTRRRRRARAAPALTGAPS